MIKIILTVATMVLVTVLMAFIYTLVEDNIIKEK